MSIAGREMARGPGSNAFGRRAGALAAMLLAAFGMVLTVSARQAASQTGSDQYASDGSHDGLMVEVTGALEQLDPATHGYGEYQITDEDSGELYAFDEGDQGLLEPYVGPRVTVTGTEPAAGEPPRNPGLLNVI